MKYAFGPFELDALSRRLERQGEPVAVPDRHIDILLLLVSRAGQVISKDALVEAAGMTASTPPLLDAIHLQPYARFLVAPSFLATVVVKAQRDALAFCLPTRLAPGWR